MATARDRMARPTQFHGVPPDERALDANGTRLPWAYEYPEYTKLCPQHARPG